VTPRCALVHAVVPSAAWASASAPRPLAAQSAAPELVVSVAGGSTFDRPLWSLRQRVLVPEPGSVLIDTVALSRSLAPGFSGWIGPT
jgi:hypothetical protein